MKIFKQLVGLIILLIAQNLIAGEYIHLLNPASMKVGTSIGEYLEVKENCPNNKITCADNAKLKYITALDGRTGRLEIPISDVGDNFEISFNIRGEWCKVNHTYALYMSDDSSLALNIGNCSTNVRYLNNSVSLNWLNGINDFRLIIKNSKLKISVNDSVAIEINLNSTLNRVVISKINAKEEDILEIRRMIQRYQR